VIVNPTEQFHQLGTRAIIGAVINNENRLSIFVCETIEKAMQPYAKTEKQSTPVVSCSLEQLIGRVFAEGKIPIDNNTTEEVLPDKWQCEDGLCQRANTMTVTFADATAV
jgi:hypothetical protein